MRDLDESWVVEAVTWILYVGFLSVPVSIAVYLELEPLVRIQTWFPGWRGTLAAVASGVAMLLVFRLVFDVVRGRVSPEETGSAAADDESSDGPSPAVPGKKRSRSKKKKKRR